jgi:hypothetical protein
VSSIDAPRFGIHVNKEATTAHNEHQTHTHFEWFASWACNCLLQMPLCRRMDSENQTKVTGSLASRFPFAFVWNWAPLPFLTSAFISWCSLSCLSIGLWREEYWIAIIGWAWRSGGALNSSIRLVVFQVPHMVLLCCREWLHHSIATILHRTIVPPAPMKPFLSQ